MVERDRQALLDVAARLADAIAEVLQAGRLDPAVVLRPGRQALLVDLRREQLGQRRAHRLLPRRMAREVDIGVDREAHRRDDMAQVGDLLARQADREAQADPGLDAAFVPDRPVRATDLEAVMVQDALDPLAPHLAVRAVRQHRRVLHRNGDLVVEAVGHPAADLLRARLAGVEHDVERVVDVVAPALLAQLRLEGGAVPGRGIGVARAEGGRRVEGRAEAVAGGGAHGEVLRTRSPARRTSPRRRRPRPRAAPARPRRGSGSCC